MSRKVTFLIALLLAAASTACGVFGGLSGDEAGTVAPGEPSGPPPEAAADEAGPAAELIPDNLSPYYEAMRAGFEGDVDAFAGGLRYWLDLALEGGGVVGGSERARYHNAGEQALDEIVFRLYPNEIAGEPILTVDSVAIGGQEAKWKLEQLDSVLRITLDDPLPPGENVEIKLDWELALEDGEGYNYARLSYVDDILMLSSFVPLFSVYEDGEWWDGFAGPGFFGDPAYSESALFDVTVTAPDDLIIAASGTTLDSTPQGDGTTAYHVVTGPMRDFALVASPDFELLSEEQNGVTVNVWSLPENTVGDQSSLAITLAAVEVYDEQFGAYPFREMDVVEVAIIAAGIEYPGLIYIDTSLWQPDTIYGEWVIAHETAHQWWYSLVGNDQVETPWMDEGLTEYSVLVYFRETQGPLAEANARAWFEAEVESYLARGGMALPLGLSVEEYVNSDAYGAFVYRDGALFFDELSSQYGRDEVIDYLQDYFARYRYGVAHLEDVRGLLVEHFGPEAGAMFDRRVLGSQADT
jgi:hypothetical protein